MPRTARPRIAALGLAALASLAVLAGCRVPEGPRLPDADTGIRVCESPRAAQSGAALSYYRFGHSECGRAPAVEVIAIHGANADGLVFARLAASLHPDERERFVSVDMPGHGRSELPARERGERADPPWLADELLPLIDWLAPDDRPRLLLCHSLAGPVCVRLLERARSRGLAAVLVNPTFPVEHGEIQLSDAARIAPQWLALDWAADAIQGMPWPRDMALRGTDRAVLVERSRLRIQATNYRLSGREFDGELVDLGTPVERRRAMFDDRERRRLARELNDAMRRKRRLDAWIDEDYDERVQAVASRLCVLLDPGDEVVDWRSTLARIEQLNAALPEGQGIGAHVFRSMQGDHSSINTVPEQVVARLRLADPCAAPGLGDPVERLPAEVERLLADVD